MKDLKLQKTQILILLLFSLCIGVSLYLLVSFNPNAKKNDDSVVPSTYTEEIQAIPIEERYPEGALTFDGENFNRNSMKFGVVPEQQKAEIEFKNQSDKKLILNLNSAPEGVALARNYFINPGSSTKILLPQLGTYIFQNAENSNDIITLELVIDPDYSP